jgi:hypothetical protein
LDRCRLDVWLTFARVNLESDLVRGNTIEQLTNVVDVGVLVEENCQADNSVSYGTYYTNNILHYGLSQVMKIAINNFVQLFFAEFRISFIACWLSSTKLRCPNFASKTYKIPSEMV